MSAVLAAGHALPTTQKEQISLLTSAIWGTPQMFEYLVRETAIELTAEISRPLVEQALAIRSEPFLRFFYQQGYLVDKSLELVLTESLQMGTDGLTADILTGHPDLWKTDMTEAIELRIDHGDPLPMVDLFFRFDKESILLPHLNKLFRYCGRKDDSARIWSLLEKFRIEKNKAPELLGFALLGAVLADNDNLVVERILQQPQVNVNLPDEYGSTPMYFAMQQKKPALVRQLLAKGAKENPDNSGVDRTISFLHEACRQGMDGFVSEFLAAGADLEALDYDEFTPLGCAVDMKNVAMIQELLTAGANPNYTNSRLRFNNVSKSNPLLHAVVEKNVAMVTPFFQPQNPIQPGPKLLGYGLAMAIEQGDVEIVERILPAVQDVNQPIAGTVGYLGTYDSKPPVIFAIEANQPQMIAPLLKHGAQLVPEGYTEEDLMCYAAGKEGAGLTLALLDAGLSAGASCGGISLLSVAVMKSGPELVNLLLERGADVNEAVEDGDFKGWTPLMAAVFDNKPEIVDLLVRKGAEPNASGLSLVEGAGQWENKPIVMTVLMKAAEVGQVGMIRTLLNAGADIDQTNSEGYTALMTAAVFGQIDAVKTLLLLGADASVVNQYGYGALGLAAFSDEPDIQKLLLGKTGNAQREIALVVAAQLGAFEPLSDMLEEEPFPPEVLDKALFGAIRAGSVSPKISDLTEPDGDIKIRMNIIRALVAAGADPNGDPRGNSAYGVLLDTRYLTDWKKQIALLLNELGADINQPIPARNTGTTPLMDAARLNEWEMAALFLEFGADPCLRNHLGETALDQRPEDPEDTTRQTLVNGGAQQCKN
jgi:ankyrin repeat protein